MLLISTILFLQTSGVASYLCRFSSTKRLLATSHSLWTLASLWTLWHHPDDILIASHNKVNIEQIVKKWSDLLMQHGLRLTPMKQALSLSITAACRELNISDRGKMWERHIQWSGHLLHAERNSLSKIGRSRWEMTLTSTVTTIVWYASYLHIE